MKPLKLIKSFCKLCAASAVIASSLTITNCGGGVGGSGSEITIRPKSLSGLRLELDDRAASLEFYRSALSESAVNNGDFEEGALIYSQTEPIVTRQMLSGTFFSVNYPESTAEITYRYTAINRNTGLLQVICSDAGYIHPSDSSPQVRIRYYSQTTAYKSTTNYFVTFSSDGNFLTNIQMRVAPNELLDNQEFSTYQYSPLFGWQPAPGLITTIQGATYFMDGNIVKFDGSPVETNYDILDVDRQNSQIALDSLDERTIFFTPDNPAIEPFSVTCANDPFEIDPSFTETGIATIFDDDNVTEIGAGTYTYEKIPGTDDGEFIIRDSLIYNNKYRLNFRTKESGDIDELIQRATGFYEIKGGDMAGETGFFTVRDTRNVR